MPKKKRRIPAPPGLKTLLPYIGPVKKARTRAEKLVDLIDDELMFGGFSGFEGGVLRVVEILNKYSVNPKSKEGQDVLKTYVEHVLEEYYGDFYHFINCYDCGKEFKPVYSLEYVNQIIAQKVFCPVCLSKKK